MYPSITVSVVCHPYLGWVDSREISDPKEIANLFCKYFSNIGRNLASKIPGSEKSHRSFLLPKLVNTILSRTPRTVLS